MLSIVFMILQSIAIFLKKKNQKTRKFCHTHSIKISPNIPGSPSWPSSPGIPINPGSPFFPGGMLIREGSPFSPEEKKNSNMSHNK